MTVGQRLIGACGAAIAGAAVGAFMLAGAYAARPRFTVVASMTHVTSGIYPAERAGAEQFAWVAPQASLTFVGLDRRAAWSCAVELRAARSDAAGLPAVTAFADGDRVGSIQSSNEYRTLNFTVPPRPGVDRTVLALAASTSFTPGRGDARTLAFRLAGWTCAPARGWALAPAAALGDAAAAAACIGAAVGAIGAGAGLITMAIAMMVAGETALALGGLGAFLPYMHELVRLAAWLALAVVVLAVAIEWLTGRSMRRASRFVLVWSVVVLDLKIAALLHPAKPVIDALFHAHRFEWVLGGRYLFTQPLFSGIEFPYSIGLYLFAVPWAALSMNHVALLDVIVASAEAVAGGLLYVMVVRTWGDRLIGAAAVALFTVVPVAYQVVGNGNLTNAFGQSAALVAVAAASTWAFDRRRLVELAAFVAVTTLALISHVTTFALLVATLIAMAVLFRAVGDASARRSAGMILLGTVLAMAASMAYYGHFMDAYRSVWRARAGQTSAASATPAGGELAPDAQPIRTPAAGSVHVLSLGARMLEAIRLTIVVLGWPTVLLAFVGLWRTWRDGARDRLSLVVAAWGIAFLVLMAVGVAAPVDASNQRYAVEFVARAAYATYPGAVILAARGGVWAWRSGFVGRLAAGAAAAGAVVLAVGEWWVWLN